VGLLGLEYVIVGTVGLDQHTQMDGQTDEDVTLNVSSLNYSPV
jgi:hypothetical protein